MKPYNIQKPLIVIHIPKAAGRSSRTVFKDWYGDNLHLHYFDEVNGKMPDYIDIDKLHSPKKPLVLYGHFNKLRKFGIEDYYPGADQFVTILRDPYELLISHYFYSKKVGDTWQDKSRAPKTDLETYLNNTKPNMLNHFPREMNINNYKDICEQYFIEIGITEKLDESLHRIAKKLGVKYSNNVPEINKTERTQKVPEGFRDQFIELHRLEYEVYNYALNKYL